MQRLSIGPLILACVLFAQSCAMLTRRSTQRIPVTSSPAGATVIVNGERQGVTPLAIRPVRKVKGQLIRIEYPGYDPFEIRLIRQTSGGPFLGNILLGLIPAIAPAGIWSLGHHGQGTLMMWFFSAAALGALFTAGDTSSGAIYEFKPEVITVTLTKAVGTPRVRTLLVDAGEFRNVKWIRVRKD